MSLKDLSKEQKQYVALGLLAAAILVMLMVLGIRFSMSTVAEAKEELDDLTVKISSANESLSRSRQTSTAYVETVAVLKKYLTNAPPERNYYSWATEVIYSKGRFADLEIDSIDEITVPQRRRAVSDDAAAISFDSYSLRITARGGYENTKYFMNLLKQDYPLVRFSGVEISSGQSQDEHNVQLFMQWPFNFGEISKSWDAVASKKMIVAELDKGQDVAAFEEPEPVHEPAMPVTSVARPDPVQEPHPPVTRPEVEETSAPEPAVEPPAPKTRPGMDAGLHAAPAPVDTAPKPAADDEIQALLSDAAPLVAEPHRTITESESMVEPQPVPELEIIVSEPEPVLELAAVPDPVIEPQSVAKAESEQVSEPGIEHQPAPLLEPQTQTGAMADTDPVPTIEQEILQLISEIETPAAASGIHPGPDAAVGLQAVSAAEAPRNYVSTDKSEKILKELLNTGSAGENASLSSFLDGLVGEINEK